MDQVVSRMTESTSLHASPYELPVSIDEEQKYMKLLVMMMRTVVPFTVNHQLKKRSYMQCLRVKGFKS